MSQPDLRIRKACKRLRSLITDASIYTGKANAITILNSIENGSIDRFFELKKLIGEFPLQIRGKLFHALAQLEQAIKALDRIPGQPVDVVILTAYKTPELDAVLELPHGNNVWTQFKFPHEPLTWFHAEIPGPERPLRVVAGSPDRTGMPLTATLTTMALLRWEPRLIVMCGSAAGSETFTNLGDILIPERIFVHDAGILVADEDTQLEKLHSDRWTVDISSALLNDIKFNKDMYFEGLQTVLQEALTVRASSKEARSKIDIHIGPLATGNTVINSERYMKELHEKERKLIGLEMEGYALLAAIRAVRPESTKGLIVKSVSDFGARITFGFRQCASKISARFVFNFIKNSSVIDWDA